MEKIILNCEVIGAIVIFILGTVFHFVFKWSGRFRPLGFIFPVSESVWEHLKLVLWPTLIFAIVEFGKIGNITNNFWAAKTLGICAAMISVVAIFYLYTWFTGHSILIIDILIFIISVIIGQFVSISIMTAKRFPYWINSLTIPLLSVLIFAFLLFTYNPPRIPIFQSPE